MQRETIQFTPEGTQDVLTLKTYLTELEAREIQKAWFTKADKFPESEKDSPEEFVRLMLVQNAQIKAVVTKLNDITEPAKILETVLNYRKEVYEDAYKKIKEIADGVQKKTN